MILNSQINSVKLYKNPVLWVAITLAALNTFYWQEAHSS